MHDIYVRDIINLCNGKLLNGNVDLVLGDFCTNTRKIKENDVYVGIRGEVFDGNKFYLDAIEKGASVCILDDVEADYKFGDATVILVEDSVKCLQELAKYKRSLYDIPIIAVTGSVGKTSTKDIIASVVGQKYKTCKTIGNYNNHIGVPLTILSLKDEEALVVEMGMNHLREIAVLSEIAKPTISVITNVGTAHIGILGSRDNILKAKLEILEGMMIGSDVIINYDNDMLSSVVDELNDKYLVNTVGISSDAKYKAINIDEDVFSSKFDIEGISNDIKVNIGGDAFIYNSLVAYAIGDILGISDKEIKNGIEIIDNNYLQHIDKYIGCSTQYYIHCFDSVNVNKKLRSLRTRQNTYTIEDLELPYALYMLGDYREAYRIYAKLLPLYWERQRYILYFICRYNLWSIRHGVYDPKLDMILSSRSFEILGE